MLLPSNLQADRQDNPASPSAIARILRAPRSPLSPAGFTALRRGGFRLPSPPHRAASPIAAGQSAGGRLWPGPSRPRRYEPQRRAPPSCPPNITAFHDDAPRWSRTRARATADSGAETGDKVFEKENSGTACRAHDRSPPAKAGVQRQAPCRIPAFAGTSGLCSLRHAPAPAPLLLRPLRAQGRA